MAETDLEAELARLKRASLTGNVPASSPEVISSAVPELQPEEIGRVAIPDKLFISPAEHCIEIYIPEARRNEIALGEYVVIPLSYRAEKLFGRIEKISYRKRDAIDDLSEVHTLISAASVGEDEYVALAQIEPISLISANGQPTEVRYIPKPNTLVRRVTSEDEVKIGLDLPPDGLFLGYVAVNGEKITVQGEIPIAYYLINDAAKTGDPLIFTHVLIAGMSGRGKTHTAKNFLRQVMGSRYTMERRGRVEREPCLILIDPEDEYWGLRDDNPNLTGVPKGERENLVGAGVKLGGVGKKLTVFAAIEAGKAYHGCDAHTDFTIPFELVNDFPYLIAGGELNEAQYAGLERLIRDFFKSSPDKSYRAFKTFIEDDTRLEPYKESELIHEATLGAIRRRVSRAQFEKIFDQGANPITALYESVFAEGVVSVFPTAHLSDEAERVVVLAIMSMVADGKTRLSDDKAWGRRIAQFPVVLAVDEAHSYLTVAQTQQDRIIVEKFVAAAKQGRKDRLGLVLITQNPQDVSEAVLSQISTRILLGMDQAMAERAGAPAHYQKALPYFEKGRMVIHAPDNSHPVEIRGLPFCVVRH
jgi:DNA helicase HerA-like ATPase